MAQNSFNPTKTALSRVYLIDGRARIDHVPQYQLAMRANGISQGFGDVEKIEIPSSEQYGAFEEVGQIRGEVERVTMTLEGRYALELKSTLLRLARKGCSVDVQVHMGTCSDPRNFDEFQKAVVLENALLTNYSTEDLGALASGDNAPVNETADISATQVYEILPLSVAERAADIVTNEVIDVEICDQVSCGECGDESGGCNKIFAITVAAGGSPSTPPDLLYSLDGGVTWHAYDIDTIEAAENPTGLTCLGQNLVIVSDDTNSLHYAALDDMDGLNPPTFTEVATGFVASKEPNAIDAAGGVAFIAGNGGYVYKTEDPTAGVEAVDEGSATVDDLLAVDALSDTFAVAVGQNGAVIYTTNGTTWTAASHPTGVGVHLNTVAVKNTREWFVGTSDGRLYYTLDGGDTWTEKTFSGSGAGQVRAIVIATDSVLYMAHDTATPRGRIFRSYNGGQSWNLLPEGTGTLPLNDRVTALAACAIDPNMVVGVGLGDNGTDGYIVVGTAS